MSNILQQLAPLKATGNLIKHMTSYSSDCALKVMQWAGLLNSHLVTLSSSDKEISPNRI